MLMESEESALPEVLSNPVRHTPQIYCTQSVLSWGWVMGQLTSCCPFFTLILTIPYKRIALVY